MSWDPKSALAQPVSRPAMSPRDVKPGHGDPEETARKARLVREFYDVADSLIDARTRFGARSPQVGDARSRLHRLLDRSEREAGLPGSFRDGLKAAKLRVIEGTEEEGASDSDTSG